MEPDPRESGNCLQGRDTFLVGNIPAGLLNGEWKAHLELPEKEHSWLTPVVLPWLRSSQDIN
jgi:hypothetical protein